VQHEAPPVADAIGVRPGSVTQQGPSALLDPATMRKFRLETDVQQAGDFFHEDSRRHLLSYRAKMPEYEGELLEGVRAIHDAVVPEDYVTAELSHQDLTGRQVAAQEELIAKLPALEAIAAHPEYAKLQGIASQLQLTNQLVAGLNAWRRVANLSRKDKVFTPRGSTHGVALLGRLFGAVFPPGVNLYAVLGEMYPAFHAYCTGQVPRYVADHMEHLLDNRLDGKTIRGIGRLAVDDKGRFLGLYPAVELPTEHLTLDSPFVAQAQYARRAIIGRVVDEARQVLQREPQQVVVVVDYAGGVGNLSELLLRAVFALDDQEHRALLLDRMRVAVVDSSQQQLAAGRRRFEQMEDEAGLEGISKKIFFVQYDIREILGEPQSRIFRETFAKDFPTRPAYLGMTAYTAGALGSTPGPDGLAPVDAMGQRLFDRCWKVFAVDFCSPMWTRQAFLDDTGDWGRAYLRTLHGEADEADEIERLDGRLAGFLKLRYRAKLETVAQFVRYMSAGPRLAAHLTCVWPHVDGHNAGYSLQEDGTFKQPGILAFADKLQSLGADVRCKSKVFLVGALDVGDTDKAHRAWVLVPGWVAEFIVAQNPHNDPFRD
jgi:hypothetical protein